VISIKLEEIPESLLTVKVSMSSQSANGPVDITEKHFEFELGPCLVVGLEDGHQRRAEQQQQ
jgi:hypothetical protein